MMSCCVKACSYFGLANCLVLPFLPKTGIIGSCEARVVRRENIVFKRPQSWDQAQFQLVRRQAFAGVGDELRFRLGSKEAVSG